MKKRIISLLLVFVLAITCCAVLGGCKKDADEKTVVTVGGWPDAEKVRPKYEKYMNFKAEFEAENPDITIEPNDYTFAVDTFLPKAAGGKLPTIFNLPMTETKKVAEAGYITDLTKYYDKYGYTENMSDNIREMMTVNGKVYYLPTSVYTLGIVMNKNLFVEAGLVDEEGYALVPDTYEQLAEYAAIITQKTGKPGFIMPTMKNAGGWIFTNIAWSFGTTFMEEKDGKWTATFDSEECAAALQWVKDLKWKYKTLSDNIFIDNAESYKMLAIGEGAMRFATPSNAIFATMITVNGAKKEDFAVGKMPKGSAGRYSLFGGSIQAIPATATDEQADAAMKWLKHLGYTHEIDSSGIAALDTEEKTRVEEGLPVFTKQQLPIYKSGNYNEEYTKILQKYCNVDMKNFNSFFDNDDVILKAEEPVNCQELYSILDSCIQEVLTNENADVKAILKKANNEFQVNYLNNAK